MEDITDTELIRKQFALLLRELTASKESIQKATKMMVEHTDNSEELFSTLMKRLKKTVAKRRLPLFYLLDSVCQVSKSKSQKEYRDLVAKHMVDIMGLVVPDDGDARDKAYSTVVKVLGLWKDRKVFSGDTVKRAKRRIEGDRTTTRDRQIVCVGMDIDAIQKQMEEDRRENKRTRWEEALRPVNDNPGAEFDEMWERFSKEEVFKQTYPGISFKNPHIRDPIRGRPPTKGLSASTSSATSPHTPNSRYSLSSPRDAPSVSSSPSAPSPSTPLSATPLYITPSSESNSNQGNTPQGNTPNPDYLYYNRPNDNRPGYPDYPPERAFRNDWPNREGMPPLDGMANRDDSREMRDRDFYEREREMYADKLPPNGPPLHNSYDGYPPPPPPPPHPVNMPPQYMQSQMRYDYERDMPPRYDHPEAQHYSRDNEFANLRGSGGREMRDVRDFRDIRDLRDLRDVRELREIGYRESGPYPPGPPLSPRSYNGPHTPMPPPMRMGGGYGYGMENGPNAHYNSVYRNGGGGGGGFYKSSNSPSPPHSSPYSPSSSMYVHQPPPSRQDYPHRPSSARSHRYPAPRV